MILKAKLITLTRIITLLKRDRSKILISLGSLKSLKSLDHRMFYELTTKLIGNVAAKSTKNHPLIMYFFAIFLWSLTI